MADAIPAADAGLLAAQAKSGMDGVAAYKAAQTNLATQKQAAVQQAMQEAAMRGSPVGAMDSQQGIIAAPYDQRIASLTQGQAAFEGDMAARDRRMADYSAATQQARTLIPGEVEKIVAPIRATGEANVRNTERQGQMAVSQIDANTQLTLTKMQAAVQAAQIAAAKAAAAKAAAEKKLTGTALTSMLSAGAANIMGTSLGNINDLIATNEAAASKTSRDVRLTDKSLWGDSAPEAQAFADARRDEIAVGQRSRLASLEGPQPASKVAPTMAKPVAPVRMQGVPQQVYDQQYAQYQTQLAAYQNSLNKAATPSMFGTPTSPFSAGDQFNPAKVKADAAAQAAATAKKQMADMQTAANQRQSVASTELDRTSLAPYQSQFGSVSNDQMRFIANSDPYLAGLLANAPAPITSKNIGSMLYGDPDTLGQSSKYSVDAATAARGVALQQLRAAGYDISDQDFMNSTTLDMKPGESFSAYQGRAYGQLSPTDLATAVGKQRADAINEEKYQAWKVDRAHDLDNQNITDAELRLKFAREMNTTDPNTGLPLEDANGNPITDSTADRTKADDAKTNTSNEAGVTSYLGSLPPSSQFGNATAILNTIDAGGTGQSGNGVFDDAFATLTKHRDPGSMSTKDWDKVMGDKNFVTNLWGPLTQGQRALLKYVMVNVHLDAPSVVNAGN